MKPLALEGAHAERLREAYVSRVGGTIALCLQNRPWAEMSLHLCQWERHYEPDRDALVFAPTGELPEGTTVVVSVTTVLENGQVHRSLYTSGLLDRLPTLPDRPEVDLACTLCDIVAGYRTTNRAQHVCTHNMPRPVRARFVLLTVPS